MATFDNPASAARRGAEPAAKRPAPEPLRRTAPMAPHESAMLALQQTVGNRMLAGLLAPAADRGAVQRQASAAPVAVPGAPAGPPADVNVGFNEMDRSHRLIEAIDQSQIKNKFLPDQRMWRRHVDFLASEAALSGLTAEQARRVDDEYSRDKEGGEGKRRLSDDLFGGGESGVPSDLTPDQAARLRALLAGTVGGPEEAGHALEAQVAQLHELLFGDLGEAEVEQVMAILRAAATHGDLESGEFERVYERVHVTRFYQDLRQLGALNAVRAAMIVNGLSDAAEALKVTQERSRIQAIDAKLKKATEGEVLDRIAASTTFGLIEQQELQKERQTLVSDIERRAQEAAAEARATAGVDPKVADEAVRQHVAAVLGDVEATAAAVAGPKGAGGAEAGVIRATSAADPGATAAASLRVLLRDDKLTPDAVTEALRALRDQAAAEAKRLHPPPAADYEVAAEERQLADTYFANLRSAWDAQRSGDDPTLDYLLVQGDESDAERNVKLEAAHGQLDPVSELVFALRGDRKDLEAVKRVLHDKSAAEIARLRIEYFAQTFGRSLDFDLFGEAPTEAGEDNPQFATGAYAKAQGKASGSDRLLLEDYVKRPQVEGAVEEVRYIATRAEREYQYTIDNRGGTGWWRDMWGNEARRVIDATITEVHDLETRYLASAGWIPMPFGGAQVARPQWTETPEAQQILHRMRLARATIRGDRAAYEKANAELRATFQAVASFVLQAVLVAVLAPVAAELFAVEAVAGAAEAAEGVEAVVAGTEAATEATEVAAGATEAASSAEKLAMNRLRAWAADTSANLASTVTANKITYGDEYGWAQLKGDLANGIGGALGQVGAEKLARIGVDRLVGTVGPEVAGGLVERLGSSAPRALTRDVEHGIASVAREEIVGVFGTTGSIVGAAAFEGGAPDISLGSVAQAHGMGKLSHQLVKGTRAAGGRLGLGGAGRGRGPARAGEETVGEQIAGEETPAVSMALPEETTTATPETPAKPETPTVPETTIPRPAETAKATEAAGAEVRPTEPAAETLKAGDERATERVGEATAPPGAAAGATATGKKGVNVLETGLATPEHIGELMVKLRDVGGPEFAGLAPIEKAAYLVGAVNERLAAQGLPEALYKLGSDLRPHFDYATWSITFPEAFLARTTFNSEDIKWFKETTIHEARHAEQTFLAARAKAGEEQRGSDWLVKTMGIPDWVAEKAVESPLHFDDPGYAHAIEWFDSIWGFRSKERNTVLNDLKVKEDAWLKALADFDAYRALPPAARDPVLLITYEGNVKVAFDAFKEREKDYLALPEEQDAYAVQARMRAKLDEYEKAMQYLMWLPEAGKYAEPEWRSRPRRGRP